MRVGSGALDCRGLTTAMKSISQNGTSTSFTLDDAGRRMTQTSTTGSTTMTTTRHYADDSDNPSWIDVVTGSGTPAVTRFAESIGGDLGATIASDKTSLGLANIHGDILTNVDIPTSQSSSTDVQAINGWSDYTEYGTPRDKNATNAVDGPVGYGWLGTKQRSATSETAGLTLMGARVYNPVRGLFTTVDPVPGGSDSAYAYPTDPINSFDLDGRRWLPKNRKEWGQFGRGVLRNRWAKGFVLTVGIGAACAFSAGIGCAVVAGAGIGAAWGAANDRYNTKRRTRWGYAKATGFGAVGGAFRGTVGYGAARYVRSYGIRNQSTWRTDRHKYLKRRSFVSWGTFGRRLWSWRRR